MEYLTENSEHLNDFDLIFEFFVFLSCNGSEEKLHKYLGPAVLPESIGKIMAILNKFISVDAL